MSKASEALKHLDPSDILSMGLSIATGHNPLDGGEGIRAATLTTLEHCCNAVRDEAEYADLLPEIADRLGCDEVRAREVLSIIGDVAGQYKLPV